MLISKRFFYNLFSSIIIKIENRWGIPHKEPSLARDIKTMEQLINYLIDYLLGLLISITIKLGVNIFNRIKKIGSKHKHD